jgi:hypothetical protein
MENCDQFQPPVLSNLGERTVDTYCKAEEVDHRAGVDAVACLSQESIPATWSQHSASADSAIVVYCSRFVTSIESKT